MLAQGKGQLVENEPQKGPVEDDATRLEKNVRLKNEKDETARQNKEWIEQHLKSDAQFNNSGVKVCILFADLVGSTAFKCRHKPMEGMEKIYTHNICVEEVVESAVFGGEVAKFMGDGVLAFFEGEDAASRGLLASLEILRRMEAENQRRRWEFPKSLSTRIGITYGPVWMMRFKTGAVRDPQGTTVDIAARLSSLAEAEQVLITRDAFEAAGGSKAFSNCRSTEMCTVRGVLEPIPLVSVALPGGVARPVVLPGGYPAVSKNTQDLLKSAAAHWENSQIATKEDKPQQAADELDVSIRKYEEVLEADVLNFDANYNLALHLVANMRNHKGTRAIRLEKAAKLLRIAVSERPGACYAWKWLSWVLFRQFREGDGPNKVVYLNEAIVYANHALHIAEANQDDYGVAIARIFLVIYLSVRLPLTEVDAQRNKDLQLAQFHTEQARSKIDAGPGKWLESRLKVGEALTGLATGRYDEQQAREILEEAAQLDRENLLAVELVVDLVEGVLMTPDRPLHSHT